jgi:hypothetical protein
MALERAGSRFIALRQPYCLLVEKLDAGAIPALLRPYYTGSWTVERRILYRDGGEYRVQWIFRDGGGSSRLVAVLNDGDGSAAADAAADAADSGVTGGKAPSGFVELYGANGLITLERQFYGAGEETVVSYQYRRSPSVARDFLIRADTRRIVPDGEGEGREEDLYTDYYRYTRNYSLRTIERVFHQNAGAVEDAVTGGAPTGEDGGENGEAAGAGEIRTALRFPRRSLDSKDEESFVSPALAYGSQFLEDLRIENTEGVVYETDERGRILGEIRRDEEGEIIAELRNQWSGNRLSRVIYRAPGEERITEYEYDEEGGRIRERNYRNGVLERVVHISGNRENEELYVDGELVLRTQWEGGRKIREERIRPRRSGARSGDSLTRDGPP